MLSPALPFVATALKMVKVPNLVQKIPISPFHTKAFDHRAKATEIKQKNIFVVSSKQETEHTAEKSSKNGFKMTNESSQGPTGVLGIGYHCCFSQVLMVSIWFILGIEYQTENDFWVLKYQFQFWYQKSQKILVSGIMKLGRKFPPIPLNFQNIVWRLYASFW